MTVNPDRIAIGTTADNPFEAEGLVLVRRLDATTAVYESSGLGTTVSAARLAETPGVAFTAPVFVIQETNSEAVLLREVIVALNPGVKADSFFDKDERFSGSRPLEGTPDQFVATVAAGYGEAALDLSNSLADDPNVAWSSPNFYQDWQKTYFPNDPRLGNQWHLHNSGQTGGLVDADSDLPEAWDINPGGSANVVVAVVDDGVPTNHPDLLNWTNPGEVGGDFVDNDGNGWVDDLNGWNFVSNNSNSGPQVTDDAHGTSVAGVAGGQGDNGQGVAGAAYKSAVMSVRIFNGGTATSDANIASGLYYAGGRTANGLGTWKAADVVNNSWGGGATSTAINAALTWGTTNGRSGKGATYFFASGNGFSATVSQPAAQAANIPGVIAVGATNNKGTRSDYSNYGTALDFVTPSNDTRAGYLAIDTTDRIGTAGYATGDYTGTGSTGFGGTSSASPLASGIGALVLAQADSVGVSLTAAQLRGLLRNNTDLIGGVAYPAATGKHPEYGTGRLNAASAVAGIGKPEISVLGASAEVANGSGTVEFGTVIIGTSADVTLRIRNQGTLPLNLSGLSVAAGAFTIVGSLSATTLNIGESATFVGRYLPTASGSASSVVTITSNDSDEGTFTFSFHGTGVETSISGTVFEDWNGNGTREANDPGIAGRSVFLDTNANGKFDSGVFVNNTPLNIPDTNAKVFSDIVVSGVGTVTDVDVTVNITHTFDGDLDVFLVSPTGTRVELFTDVGGTGENFTNTILDDEATTAIGSGTVPFTGRFRPEGLLSSVDGQFADGTWRLEIADDAGGDVGTLTNWTLELNNLPSEPNATTSGTGFYSFLGLTAGTYTVLPVVPTGWTGTGPSGGQVVNYAGTGSVTGVNHGLAKNNRFYGRVVDDKNADGIFSPAEPGIPNRGVFLDSNGNGSYDPGIQGVFTNSTPLPIPDNNTKVFSSNTIGGLTGTVSDVELKLNITHPYDSDLNVFLIGPNGTRVELFTAVGGNGDNFVNTILDDQAANLISGGSAPFTGTFRPEGSLAALNGINPNGLWQLEIADAASQDVGTLTNWTLTITNILPEPLTPTDATGNAAFDLSAGSHAVGVVPISGWKFTAPASGMYAVTAAGAPLTDKYFGVAEAVAPTVSSVTIDSGGIQRSRVGSLTVTFSERVQFVGTPAAAFAVSKVGGGAVGLTAAVNDSGPGTVVTLGFTDGTEFGSLLDGKYSLAVIANQVVDVAQNSMAANSTTPFTRLFGDGNGDASVTGEDFELFGITFGIQVGQPGYNAAFDGNADGSITGEDYEMFGQRFGISL